MLMIIKMTAPQEADREWANSIEFARGTQDSTAVTNYKNGITHTPRDFRSIRWMMADNKTMYQILIGKRLTRSTNSCIFSRPPVSNVHDVSIIFIRFQLMISMPRNHFPGSFIIKRG